ncbi:hypothetical protein CL634_02905 [bacterium]|nr:hypothetical protein [bacterium]
MTNKIMINNKNKILEFGILAYIFLLPWQARWIWQEASINGEVWEYGRYSLYATEILLWLLIIVWTLINRKKLALAFRRKLPVSQSRLALLLPILLALIWSGLTIFWSADVGLAYSVWFKMLEGAVLFTLLLNSKIRLEKFLATFTFAGVVQGLIAVWQFVTQSVIGSKWFGVATQVAGVGDAVIETSTGRWLRAYGTLPHPNILGGFLVVAILITIALYIRFVKRLHLWAALATLPIMGAGLFFSFSRSAALALVASWLLWVIVGIYKNQKYEVISLLKTGVVLVATFVVLAFMYQPLVATRYTSQGRLEINSLSERQIYENDAKQLLGQRTVVGRGIGQFTGAVYSEVDSTRLAWDYQPVHNLNWLLLVELGLVGWAFFIFVALFYLTTFARLNTPAWPAFAALLVISFFDHYVWTLAFGIILFWLILSLNIKYSQSKSVHNEAP